MTQRSLFDTVAAPLAPLLDRRTVVRATADGADLDMLRAVGILRDVDVHFARTVARLAGEHDPRVILGLAVASRAPGSGHVCAELGAPDRLVRLEQGHRGVRWPEVAEWRDALAASAVVALPNAASADRPLVLDGERLYLSRYWGYQQRLLGALRHRAVATRSDVDDAVLAAGLERLFPASGDMAPDLQRVAACIAVLRGFTVITGGPGTGKTRTVLRVLALLVEQAIALGVAPPRILLAAPTGKAAARLAESIVAGLATLPCDAAVIAAIPRSAGTLHRSLAWQPRTPTRFRHDASNPLTADVVLVDEASMVDLALMAKLVDAVPAGARLIFLGDRDQLASVEAGSILADVCGEATNRFSATFAARISAVSGETRIDADGTSTAPIADGVVRLVRSHRFRDDGGIGALARAINDGDAGDALRLLGSDGSGEIALVSVGDASVAAREIVRHAVRGYRAALGSEGPEAALRALDRFRVLTAHRGGSLGVAALNGAIVAALVRDGTLPRDARNSSSFAGQPVLITQNDPALGLYNGDAGVVLAELGGVVRVWFRTADGVRGISPARLPAHETAFAMTVHKAQGSEFDEVVLVLPSDVSPVLTRELLYTGVSRARSRVTIIGSPDVMRAGIAERVQRASGLREALWQS